MEKTPKSIWIIFDPLDGSHIFKSKEAAKRQWEKWFKEAGNDVSDSFWDMSEPTEYRKALSKEHRKELLDHTEEIPAMFCAHANENPMVCECPPNCYCQTRTCKNKEKD